MHRRMNSNEPINIIFSILYRKIKSRKKISEVYCYFVVTCLLPFPQYVCGKWNLDKFDASTNLFVTSEWYWIHANNNKMTYFYLDLIYLITEYIQLLLEIRWGKKYELFVLLTLWIDFGRSKKYKKPKSFPYGFFSLLLLAVSISRYVNIFPLNFLFIYLFRFRVWFYKSSWILRYTIGFFTFQFPFFGVQTKIYIKKMLPSNKICHKKIDISIVRL